MINYTETNSENVLQLLGKSIATDIKQKHLLRKDVAKKANVTEVTLRRICEGENVKLESVIKVLQVLNRDSALTALINPSPVNPMSLYPQMVKERNQRLKKQKKNVEYVTVFACERVGLPEKQKDVSAKDIKKLFE